MKNPFKFNVVIFNDGTYGARKGLFSYKYVDLRDPQFIWITPDSIHKYAKGTLEQATKAANQRNKPFSKFI